MSSVDFFISIPMLRLFH